MNTENLKYRESRQQEDGKKEPASMDWLVEKGEWDKLKDNKEYQSLSVEGRIFTATQAVDVRIKQMEKVFGQVLAYDPEGAGVILDKTIKPMRVLNRALGARLVGEYQKEDDVNASVNDVLGIESRKQMQPKKLTQADFDKAA